MSTGSSSTGDTHHQLERMVLVERSPTDSSFPTALSKWKKSVPILLLYLVLLAVAETVSDLSWFRNNDNNNGLDSSVAVLQEKDEEASICDRALKDLIDEEIRLVAIDFDATIINIHTGGRWKGDADRLSQHVRPSFQCLIDGCLRIDIPVAVATFSKQVNLLHNVLNISLSSLKENTEIETTFDIPVFGGDTYVPDHNHGKQSQLLTAIEYFNKKGRHSKSFATIVAQNTLLIDDDKHNIKIARQDGYRTLLFYPNSMEVDTVFSEPFQWLRKT